MFWLSTKSLDWPRFLIFGAAAAVSTASLVIRAVRSRLAQSWPTVDGTVESHWFHVEGFGDSKREIAEVNYSYRIDGEYYSGSHEVAGEFDFGYFPKGSRVLVHYKQSDPAISFLDREEVRSREAAES